MYKKNLLKATSVLTAFALACSTMAGCGIGKKTEDTIQVQDVTEESPEAEELVETMTKTAFTGSKENAESGKEETVYVMTDANGTVDEVVVSNWLKNANGDKALKDTTNLKDIVNVKGEESFKDNGDGTVTWDAEGSDIYYQGTPTEEVPVGVKVTYELDGQQMKAEDIAGKSGSVKIRFDYTNSLTKEVEIDGEKENIDVPFTMISGTMLDNEKFANVKVSNGKVISDANNYVVVGVAMPGLKESLKLDDEKLAENDIDAEDVDIPDYVEITADVQDFELPMTVSMASANVVSDLGLDKIYNSDKIDDLNGDMDKLSDASTELRDGSGELADGTDKFADGTSELYDGTVELKDGTGELKDGVSELKNGAGELKNGAGELKDGVGELKDGAGKLNDGTKDLKSGTGELKTGAEQLETGTKKLATGASKLSTGIGTYTEAVGQIATGAKSVDDGVATLQTGATTLTGGITSAKDGAKSVSDGAAQLSAGLNTMSTELQNKQALIALAEQTFHEAYAAVIDAVKAQTEGTTVATRNASYSNSDISGLVSEITNSLADAYVVYASQLSAETERANSAERELEELRDENERLKNSESDEAVSDNKAENDNQNNAEDQNNDQTQNNDQPQNDDASQNGDASQNNEAKQENDNSQNGEAADNGNSENIQDESASTDNGETSDNGNSENTQDESAGAENVEPETQPSEQSSDSDESVDGAGDAASTEETVTLDANTVDAAETAVEGIDEYAGEAGWAAIQALTQKDKAYWDAQYELAYQTIYGDSASAMTQKKQQLQGAKSLGDSLISAAKSGDVQTLKQTITYAANADSALAPYAQYAASDDLATLTSTATQMAIGIYSGALSQIVASFDDIQNAATGGAKGASAATALYMTDKMLLSGADTINTIYNGTGQGGLKDIQTGASQLAVGANSLYTGMQKLDEGGSSLTTGIGSLKEGTNKLYTGANQLNSNSKTLNDGGKDLAKGAGELKTGTSKLADGTKTLDEGAGKLADGVNQLYEGTGKLYDGTGKLYDGTGELYDGTGKLYDGAVELDNGVGKLKDGAGELKDGAVELNDGARKLADGMVEFDEDGIQKLTSTVDEDLLSVTDRLKAVDEASQSYTSFSGANDDEPSSVQFIIRTAPVKSDKD